jgi:hypothetical protein
MSMTRGAAAPGHAPSSSWGTAQLDAPLEEQAGGEGGEENARRDNIDTLLLEGRPASETLLLRNLLKLLNRDLASPVRLSRFLDCVQGRGRGLVRMETREGEGESCSLPSRLAPILGKPRAAD